MTELLPRLRAALAGRYAFERELGRGGMATVYLARDLRHDRLVALKVLQPELAALLGAERFLHEIRVTAHLQHPNILPLFDSGETDGFLFYVMPYVEGESLRARLNREKQLPITDALGIAGEVASALDYAHRQGIIHRDIKPENILLHDGRALVADFGIALAVREAGGGRLTETGLSLGTPFYMSPEQATGEREITARSDIYALGCVLYEMLVGQPPFTGPTAQSVVAQVLTEEPKPITSRRRSVPPEVERAVLTALEKLPADRYASAAAFARALTDSSVIPTTPKRARSAAHLAATAPARLGRPLARALPWVVAAAAAGLAAYAFLRPPTTVPARTFTAYLPPPPATDFGGGRRFAALAPDGSRLAFVGFSSRGGSQLWVQDLQRGGARPLSGTSDASWPFWSPDGGSLGFFARGWLLRVPADGESPPVALCPTAIPTGGTWGEGNVILFSDRSTFTVHHVAAAGGACTRVLQPMVGDWGWEGPSFLPGGRSYIVTRVTRGTADQLWLVDLRTGTRQMLRDGSAPAVAVPGYLVFNSFFENRAEVQAQPFDLRRHELKGKAVTVADSVWEPMAVASFTVSRNGVMIYRPGQPDLYDLLLDRSGQVLDTLRQADTWTHRSAHHHPWVAMAGVGVWLYDLSRKLSSRLGQAEYGWNPVWSPGDSLLAYVRGCEIHFVRVVDGRDSLLHDFGTASCPVLSDWSPDGHLLLFTRQPGDTARVREIWQYALDDGSIAPVVAGGVDAQGGTLSPDGRWLAYTSSETGSHEIYLRPFKGFGRRLRVSPQGGVTARWRADGRELFYHAPDGHVMAVTVFPGADLKTGQPTPLFYAPIAPADAGAALSFDIAPDGRTFVVHPPSTVPGQPLVLLTDWMARAQGAPLR